MSMRIAVGQDRYYFDMLGGRISKGKNLFNALDNVNAQNGKECGDKIGDGSGWKPVGSAFNGLRPGIMSDRDYEIIIGKLFDAVSKSGCSELKGGATYLLTRVKATSSLRKFAGKEFTLSKAIYYGDGKCMYKILDNQHFRNILSLIGVNGVSRAKFIDRAKKVTPARLSASIRVQEGVFSLLGAICEVTDPNDVVFSTMLEIKREKDFEVLMTNKMTTESIKYVKIAKGVSSIPLGAFDNCSALLEVEIPSSVDHIGSYAFQQCESLKSIDLPEGIKTIGYAAFQKCQSLKKIIIPHSMENMEAGGHIFEDCTNLEEVVLDGSKEFNIGAENFSGCVKLRKITIPDNIEFVCSQAFKGCPDNMVIKGNPRQEVIDEIKIQLPKAVFETQ